MADTYKVKKGDTLWDISKSILGSGATNTQIANKVNQLASINSLENPNKLYIGQVLKLSGSPSSNTKTSKCCVIKQFGMQSDVEDSIFATWTWSKDSDTDVYHSVWEYLTVDGVWFVQSEPKEKHLYSTCNVPKNAKRMRFRVKPIPITEEKNDVKTSRFESDWTKWEYFDIEYRLPDAPDAPTVTIEGVRLTADLSGLTMDAKQIEFKIVKDDKTVFKTGKATIVKPVSGASGTASYGCAVTAGSNYKVCCRAVRDKFVSEWSPFSENKGTAPLAPDSINKLYALSETSVYVLWTPSSNSDNYDVEYTTNKNYFDANPSEIKKVTVNANGNNHAEITGLETGKEYFFRVRATNTHGQSKWTAIQSVTIGAPPAAPTTWSSTTTAITGETLYLYWAHNAEDGSSQTFAELELTIGTTVDTYTIGTANIDNSVIKYVAPNDDEKDKAREVLLKTTAYPEGTSVQWRVRTAGITKEYGDWSASRTIDIYAPPTNELHITNLEEEDIEVVTTFPFYISCLAGPNTQEPVGYHISILSNDSYETVDNLGNPKMVSQGESVYSKYFETSDPLLIEISANNIDLENGMRYTVTGVVSMNSGLTAESSKEFDVSWEDKTFTPNAEIGVDPDTLVTHIRPYCEERLLEYVQVLYENGIYTATSNLLGYVYGERIDNAFATTGQQVYKGVAASGEEVFFCKNEVTNIYEGVTMAVYRREFDGTFTEIASGLDSGKNTYVTDPHPALDYARYRIVAITNNTGAVSYYDMPGYPVNCTSVVIQWDEQWSNFDVTESSEMSEPPWSGSMLKLPYNVDVSDNYGPDVEFIEYIGRKRPVGYYGTQLGESSSWSVAIDKEDVETLYALRRLAIWTGNAYVREPSGSGYWANVVVSFSQTHCEVTIPVTLKITRVEGGA